MVWLLAGGAAFGQQGPDPKFDAKVAKPAYTDKHPRVLFDEGHFNVHSMKAGYKAFADLVANDGYQVTASNKPFDAKTLAGCDIVVSANRAGRRFARKGPPIPMRNAMQSATGSRPADRSCW